MRMTGKKQALGKVIVPAVLLAAVLGVGWPTAGAAVSSQVANANQVQPTKLLDDARRNTAFRRVIATGRHVQLVLMSLMPGQNIGMETHPGNDQVVVVVTGAVTVTLGSAQSRLADGDAILIPAGTAHDVQATGPQPAKLIIYYAPPLHPTGELQLTKP